MINRGATLLGRTAILFAMLFAFTACGGGGGGGDGFLPNQNGGPTMVIALQAPDGSDTDSVTAAQPGTVVVQVTGVSVSNVVVSASVAPGTLGSIDPPSGTALTDSSGFASFRILAANERGAATVVVTAQVDGVDLDASLGFQVGDTGLRLGFFDDDGSFVENQIFVEPASTLTAGGNAQLSVVLLDENNQRITTAEEVTFNSGCITAGLAVINPTPTSQTVNGEASTLYTAEGCEGVDEITASTGGSTAQAFATVTVSSPETNAIAFESVEPALIVLRGTGGTGRDETSEVLFTVVDGNGMPLQGVTVNFDLTTDVGGIELSTDSALSNGDGQVRVIVQSGDVSTVARVIAQVDDGSGELISTLSDQLTITTGLPDQNSISVGVAPCDGSEGFVVANGGTVNGLCRTIVVNMADKFNNPVVDGTAAVFTTEYGTIESSCVTANGECSVEWRSGQPRFPTLTGRDEVKTIYDSGYSCPSHNGTFGPCPDDLGTIRGLRSNILVHAIGEESFIDRNGNGIMDQEEEDLFSNLPEAFVDHNEDGIYTPGLAQCEASPQGSAQCISGNEEIFVDFNANDTYDLSDDPAVFNGLLCPPKGDGIWCSRELVHVRAQTVVIMSLNDTWDIVVQSGGNFIPGPDSGSNSLRSDGNTAYISDLYNNPPPAGSGIRLSADENCELLGETTFTVPNLSSTGAVGVTFFTNTPDPRTDTNDPGRGTVTITLTPTDGVAYSETFECEAPLDCTSAAVSPRDPSCPALPAP
ncbi:MAG: Ig-like domain-containing protein [Halioglobus sp.]